jgi:hypothetical protein
VKTPVFKYRFIFNLAYTSYNFLFTVINVKSDYEALYIIEWYINYFNTIDQYMSDQKFKHEVITDARTILYDNDSINEYLNKHTKSTF